ncbi:MAG: cupin domain-containing protein [Chloroflexi bacterium]|nr:cupin domain-containing protein [Chloroflexota bacterium]
MSEFHRFSVDQDKFRWQGVEALPLEEEGLKNVTKHVLIGESEGAPNYIMRYFHLEPGGHSKLERHPQEHEVIVLKGAGEVQIAETTYSVNPFDVVFIEGGELHQFRALEDQDLGFICIIPKMA